MATLALKIRGVKDRPRARVSTVPLVVDKEDSGIYGRDEDKKTIISLLRSGDETNNRIGVIPIAGMGGIGKTTLAQLVYNDASVKEGFDLRAWVRLPDDLDVVRITQSMYESICSQTFVNTDLDRLQHQLKSALAGKKFLFVLDDVWRLNYAGWDVLSGLFQSGAQGSKIIVTTRHGDVASRMGTLPTLHLLQLSERDCWNLFAEHAFENEKVGAHSRLEEIGRQISRKCKGLPLAAKSLGGLLRSEMNPKQWEMIYGSYQQRRATFCLRYG